MSLENYDRWLAAQEDAHMDPPSESVRDLDDGYDAPEAATPADPRYRVTELHMPLVVPGWANWMAIDPNGDVWVYEHKPLAGEHGWMLGDGDHNYRRAMVCETGWWWVDLTAVPDVYADWTDRLYQVAVRA